jgi:tetratricopeptide (TPR) repeat protein
VCSSPEVPSDAVPLLLANLVDRSLLTTNGRGTGQRFRLLRPVAEHARGRLADLGEVAEMRRRHTSWLAAETRDVTARLRGPAAIECAQQLNTELPNLVRAAQWALDEGDPVDALQIGVNLGWYAFVSANVQNDEQLLVELLQRAVDAPAPLRCRAQMWAGLLSIGRTRRRTWAMDAVDVARTASAVSVERLEIDGVSLTVDSIAMARRSGDPALLLETLTVGSLHLSAIGSHPDTLRALNLEARALAIDRQDRWSRAFVGALDGLAAYVAGELETSIDLLGAAAVELQEVGDLGTAALFMVSFSEVAELVGDIAGATAAMATALEVGTVAGFRSAIILRAVACWLRGRNGEVEAALELGREVAALARSPFNPVVRAQALFALGVAETLAGEYNDADLHLRDALSTHQRLGMAREAAMDHRHLGDVLMRRDDVASAVDHHRKAVGLALQVGLPWTVMLTARSLACSLVVTQPAIAARLVGLVNAISTTFHYFPTADEVAQDDHVLGVASGILGASAVERERVVGSVMHLDALPALLDPHRT